DKAAGYGMPGFRVDGGDVLAAYEVTRDAVARARAGEGPTFIEAVSYRTAPHATADDPRAYIDLERVEEEKQRECLGRYEAYLRRAGVLNDELAESTRAEAGILGTAVGLCMAGWRPVCEMQYDAFSYPCLDQLITHVGRYRWRTQGGMEFPLVVRMPYGGGVRAPELHDDSPEAYYVHTPG